MNERQCEVCGTAFTPQRANASRGGGKYCSRQCYYDSKTTRVELPCSVCGKPFIAFPSKIAKGCGKFCSRACTAIHKSKDDAVKKHPLHCKWRGMIRRCHSPEHRQYPTYGARGIYVCDRWRNDFWAFAEDMGLPPSKRHSIDRIDNDGPYAPENCRWATMRVQSQNRRSSIMVRYKGEEICLSECARLAGVHYPKLYNLVRKHGLTAEAAIEQLAA